MKPRTRIPRTLAAMAAGLVALAGAIAPQATAAEPSPPGDGWTLAFGDEFDGTTVDTAKWGFRTDVKAYSAQRKENVTESGGSLSINLKKETYASTRTSPAAE